MRVPIVKSKIEVTQKGAVAKYGLELIRIDTDHFKSWVHERVRWPDDQPGAWHLPADASEDYCKQIISEARIRLSSGKVRWVEHSKENHFLDCEAMQAAAAQLLNVVRIGAGTARPATGPPVRVPLPDDDTEGGPVRGYDIRNVRDHVDPNEVHQAYAASRQPPSSSWILNGRARGSWFNPNG